MPLDNAVADREAKPSSLRPFGGKEGFEDFLLNVFSHTRSAVGKLQSQASFLSRAAYRELAASRHRIHSVHDYINKDFAQFGGATICVLSAFDFQLDLTIETPLSCFVLPASARYFNRVAQQTTNVKPFKFSRRRLAREGLNTTHGCGGILCCGLDDLQIAYQRVIFCLAAKQLSAAENSSKGIVKIVGNSGSQLPQSAQLICSSRPLTLFFLFGDIAGDAQHSGRASLDY